VATFSLSKAVADERNLCRAVEVNVASCETTNGKYASICAAREGLVYYRFGGYSKVELDVEFSAGRQIFRWVDLNTYITFFGFNRGGYSYVFGVPQETLGATAFLVVKKAGERFSYDENFTCKSNSFGEKDINSEAIKDVEDERVRGNGFLFPPGDSSKIDGAAH
jgi:hypothetical protein